MNYYEFLDNLKAAGWSVPNKSFASHEISGEWQAAFIRLGGRYQLPGKVAFVVCIRHACLRDREKERPKVVKDPHDYPFKLKLEEIASGYLQYSSRLLGYELSYIDADADWTTVLNSITDRVPAMLLKYSKTLLRQEILERGTDGYIERIWAEDLAA